MTIGQNTVSGEMLRNFIERIETLEVNKKAITDDIKMVFAEVKAAGFNTTILKNMIKLRKAKPADLEEFDALQDMYKHALGMLPDPPLFRAVGLMDVDVNARDNVIDAFKLLIPEKGEIIVKIGDKPVRLQRPKGGEVVVSPYVEPSTAVAENRAPARAPSVDVPDCADDEAKELGRKAHRESQPIISNPFPAGDKRRPLFDLGWREESGSDGMGEDD